MSPIVYPQLDYFLLGFITASSLVAALFFMRFWRDTRDMLFLAFAAFFLLQGASDLYVLRLQHPNEGNFWLFLLRFVSIAAVVAAILRKNMGKE
jgi:uncharacterized membrane protein HdeD (DUF308 family)